MQKNIAVIIVLYLPTGEQLSRLERLARQTRGVIVDNSPTRLACDAGVGCMQYVFCGGNVGIATAQNIGIRKLMESGDVDYIVFLDQDSDVECGYCEKIATEYESISQTFPKLAILGPTIYDKDSPLQYGSVIHKDKHISSSLIVRDKIISSGSCVATRVLSDIGLMEDDLFIDFVDSEWCWRANSKGYLCCITSNIRMSHRIGLKTIKMGIMRDVVSAPFRYFYQYRNYLWLARRKHVPLKWKINNGIKNIVRLFYYPLFVDDGCKCIPYMVRGILKGVFTSPAKECKDVKKS